MFIWGILNEAQALSKENKNLEISLAQKNQIINEQTDTVDRLRLEAKRLDQLLVNRQDELKEVVIVREKAKSNIKAYIRDTAEPNVKPWAETHVPIGIYRRLFELKDSYPADL